jgi:hypothetical protein
MKDDPADTGPGEHSSNFVVYDNDVDSLVGELIVARDTFDPHRRLETFREEQPHLLHGDTSEVTDFLHKIETGHIHSRLHREHVAVGR